LRGFLPKTCRLGLFLPIVNERPDAINETAKPPKTILQSPKTSLDGAGAHPYDTPTRTSDDLRAGMRGGSSVG
jgi:hypothetical protein